MTLKAIVAALLIAVPVCAQAQSPSAPKANKGDGRKKRRNFNAYKRQAVAEYEQAREKLLLGSSGAASP
jgi:hypothetical protein